MRPPLDLERFRYGMSRRDLDGLWARQGEQFRQTRAALTVLQDYVRERCQ